MKVQIFLSKVLCIVSAVSIILSHYNVRYSFIISGICVSLAIINYIAISIRNKRESTKLEKIYEQLGGTFDEIKSK